MINRFGQFVSIQTTSQHLGGRGFLCVPCQSQRHEPTVGICTVFIVNQLWQVTQGRQVKPEILFSLPLTRLFALASRVSRLRLSLSQQKSYSPCPCPPSHSFLLSFSICSTSFSLKPSPWPSHSHSITSKSKRKTD